MTENDFKPNESAVFAEWRGTVKTALDFIKRSLNRLEAEDKEQWETIEQIRGMLEKHRDRCDQLSKEKAPLTEFSELKTEVANQGKTQIKQGMTMVFYGLIGGALFSLLLALFNHFVQTAGSS